MCLYVPFFFFLNHIAMVNLSFRFKRTGKYLVLNYLVLLVPGRMLKFVDLTIIIV